jgi:hypothetical protein
MDSKTIEILNNSEFYSDSEKCLFKIIEKKISFRDIKTILNLENKLIVDAFLKEYRFFESKDLKYIEQFILNNLNHADRAFVSDLIEFATDWDLILPYETCIEFLKKCDNDNNYVQLAVIDYIFENLKFSYIEKIVNSLKSILNDSKQNLSVQILSAFVLFRITMKKEYLEELTDLAITENYQELLKNILNREYNKQEYFDFHGLLEFVCYTKEAKIIQK